MKKSLLILALSLGLAAAQVAAQTITVAGSTQTINPGEVFDVTITLSVSGSLPSDVTALNLLLATPTSGANSGVGFTVQHNSGGPNFPTRVGPGTISTFNTVGSGPNAGFTISDPANDLGSAGPGQTAPFSDVAVSILRFTAPGNIAPGKYDFRATLGFDADPNGSFINVASGTPDTFAVNNAPTFSVTVVPEPSTWAMLVIGGVGLVGAARVRAKRRA